MRETLEIQVMQVIMAGHRQEHSAAVGAAGGTVRFSDQMLISRALLFPLWMSLSLNL